MRLSRVLQARVGRVMACTAALALVVLGLVGRPLPASASIPEAPQHVAVVAAPLGLSVSWSPATSVSGVTGYRVWLAGLESESAQFVPPDTHEAFLGTPDAKPHAVLVATQVASEESEPATTPAVAPSAPAGVTGVAGTPVTVYKASLAARASATVSVLGHGSIPSSGVAGVWATVDATAGKKATSVQVLSGASSSPALALAKGGGRCRRGSSRSRAAG